MGLFRTLQSDDDYYLVQAGKYLVQAGKTRSGWDLTSRRDHLMRPHDR